jgi:hypothetical protein
MLKVAVPYLLSKKEVISKNRNVYEQGSVSKQELSVIRSRWCNLEPKVVKQLGWQ